MKKLITLLTVILFLITTNVFGAITEQEARKYIDVPVYMVLDYFTDYHIYGIVSDIIIYEGELNLILKMTYNDQKEMMIKLEDVLLIRKRKPYEYRR